MAVEYNFIESLNKNEMDQLLSTGWFRCVDFFVRAQLICLDEKISSIVNIRLPLNTYKYKKSHKRIINRVEKNFSVKIGKALLTEKMEHLYDGFKNKLHGFIFFKLNDFFYGINDPALFNTHEISIYDKDKLIAVSFFDLGEKSMSSILCLYDLHYQKYSLGSYTMLKEIQYGLNNGFEYYYPGYILDNNPRYDYKLSIGSVQYLNDSYEWSDNRDFTSVNTNLTLIYDKTDQIENQLIQKSIPYARKINPFYAHGYITHFPHQFIKSIIPILISYRQQNEMLLIEYNLETEEFVLSDILNIHDYDFMKEAQDNSYYENKDIYLTDFYLYRTILAKTKSIQILVDNYLIPILENSAQKRI